MEDCQIFLFHYVASALEMVHAIVKTCPYHGLPRQIIYKEICS
jgi:hypothetical protein